MPKLVLRSLNAARLLAGEAEALWENRRDDLPFGHKPEDDADCSALARLAVLLHQASPAPSHVDIEERDLAMVKLAMENCLDHASSLEPSHMDHLSSTDIAIQCQASPQASDSAL